MHNHYLFFDSVGASLTEPLENVVHNASALETVDLRCNGTGIPAPNITLTYVMDGEVRVFRQAVGELVQFPYIVVPPLPMVFNCTASNRILNEDGEAEEVSESVTITINQV